MQLFEALRRSATIILNVFSVRALYTSKELTWLVWMMIFSWCLKYSICFTKLNVLAANLKGQTLEIVPWLTISENQQRRDLIKACILHSIEHSSIEHSSISLRNEIKVLSLHIDIDITYLWHYIMICDRDIDIHRDIYRNWFEKGFKGFLTFFLKHNSLKSSFQDEVAKIQNSRWS